MGRYGLIDPITGKSYNYVTRDEKEDRLYQALKMSLNDECPPDREDYFCNLGEEEDFDCQSCWLRWATKNHKV